MDSMQKRNPMIGLGLSTAMAAVMLTGCATNGAQPASVSAAQAQQAIASGEHSAAVQAAEAAVAADPRNADYRMTLGNAYLEAGRFNAASTSFEDAMALGERSPRAALSLALALTGQARYAEAASVLNDWQGEIAASDLGLAYALAGQPERGIHVLTNAIRGGDNTVKTRQNLAYAYAVAGRWRESRMMVAQDVPAHEVGDRMSEWAQMTHAEAYNARVAGLLGVPANVRDSGQPVQLALVNSPSAEQLALEATGPAAPQVAGVQPERMSVPATGGELPAVGAPAPRYETQRAPAPTTFAEAFVDESPRAAPAPALPEVAPAVPAATMSVPALAPLNTPGASAPAPATAVARSAAPAPRASAPAASSPRAAAAPASRPAPAARASRASATPDLARPSIEITPHNASGDATHLVQLGSFASEAGARRAWNIYQSRYPELADSEMVITQARVNGRNYWRVSAAGFDRNGSRAMCGRVDASSGDGCISWAASSPLPGAIDTGVRMARR